MSVRSRVRAIIVPAVLASGRVATVNAAEVDGTDDSLADGQVL